MTNPIHFYSFDCIVPNVVGRCHNAVTKTKRPGLTGPIRFIHVSYLPGPFHTRPTPKAFWINILIFEICFAMSPVGQSTTCTKAARAGYRKTESEKANRYIAVLKGRSDRCRSVRPDSELTRHNNYFQALLCACIW